MAIDPDLSRASPILARLNILTEVLSLEAAEVFALAGLAGRGLGRYARIGVDGRFERVSVSLAFPAEPDRGVVIAELSRRDRMFGERVERDLERDADARLELEHLPTGVSLAIAAAGRRPLTRDLEELREHTHAGDAVNRATRLLAAYAGLGGKCVALVDQFRPPAHHSWQLFGRLDARDDAAVLLDPMAEELEITAPQRGLLDDMHPILARRAGCEFGLRLGPGVIYPELDLVYRDIDVGLVIRMLVGLGVNRDPGPSLGTMMGALGAADELSRVQLTLRDVEPPLVRLGVEVHEIEPKDG